MMLLLGSLQEIRRLALVCLTIALVVTTAKAQQRILWQGAVMPERINVYANASTKDRVTTMLKKDDVVDVVLEINTLGDAWCRVAFSGQSEPLGYVLCLHLEQGHFKPTQPARSAAAKLEPGTYYWTGNGWAAMQSITMSGGGLKHEVKVFVPGLTPQMVWTFRDSQAPVQIQGETPLFCVKFLAVMAGTPYAPSAREIVVVRFDRKKDHRELQTTNGGNEFTFKSGLSKDRMPDINVSPLDANTYLVSPKFPLQVGEYLLSTPSMGVSGYDFGVSSREMVSQ